MKDVVKGKHVLLILILSIVPVSMLNFLAEDAIAQSPSFVRQEFEDKRNDWAEGQRAAEKMEGDIDITEVSYLSDGRTLNFTFWFDILSPTFNFETTNLRFGIYIDVDSKNNTGVRPYGFEYGLASYRKTDKWVIEFSEYPSEYMQVKKIQDNSMLDAYGFTGGILPHESGYFRLSMNLQEINYPTNYKVILYARSGAYGDYTEWQLIPPPKMDITSHPNPIEIAQGEEKTLEIHLASNAAIGSQIHIYTSKDKDITTHFQPDKFQLAANGRITVPVIVKASENARISPHTLQVFVDSIYLYQPSGVPLGFIPANVTLGDIQDMSKLTVVVVPWWQRISSFFGEFGLIIGLIVGGAVSQLWTWLFDTMKKRGKVKKSNSSKT